jgi:hypothetical protein
VTNFVQQLPPLGELIHPPVVFPSLAQSVVIPILPGLVSTSHARPLLQSLKEHAALLCVLVSVMWAVEIVDLLLPMVDLDQYC